MADEEEVTSEAPTDSMESTESTAPTEVSEAPDNATEVTEREAKTSSDDDAIYIRDSAGKYYSVPVREREKLMELAQKGFEALEREYNEKQKAANGESEKSGKKDSSPPPGLSLKDVESMIEKRVMEVRSEAQATEIRKEIDQRIDQDDLFKGLSGKEKTLRKQLVISEMLSDPKLTVEKAVKAQKKELESLVGAERASYLRAKLKDAKTGPEGAGSGAVYKGKEYTPSEIEGGALKAAVREFLKQ